MALDRSVLALLRKYAGVFKDARDRNTNEADTIMYLVRFFEEVLGFDSLKGEISREFSIKDRYCDLCLKIDGTPVVLVEGKPANHSGLVPKHIEQAENYASRSGIVWVLLSNGIEWKLYHLTFAEGEGITHDVAFEANLLEEVEADAEALWNKLSLLSRSSLTKGLHEEFWGQKKALSPASVVRALFAPDVLASIRKELNRTAPARLDMEDVFAAVRDTLSKEALMEAGDITLRKKRKKRRKVVKTDPASGQQVTVEEETEENGGDDEPSSGK